MKNKVYSIITEQIIDQLNQGKIPWNQPWIGGRAKNLISGKEYRGINTFILGSQRAKSPYWLSYKQAQQLGGNVKKGEKSTMIVFWKQVQVDDKDSKTGKKTIPMLRYYRVFNSDQCNLPENKTPVLEANQNFQPIEQCERIVSGMPKRPTIQHQESKAYYSPSDDFVNMPAKNAFEKEEFYYSVLFHELGHSTGHASRCARKKFHEWQPFGSDSYSKEELVAEMTAAFLCGESGIERETIQNSAAYIQSWTRKFKENVKLVVLAAAQAQKAADFIMGRNQTKENKP